MTQTTNSIWGGAAKVEISVNGTAWTDISGHGIKVSPSGGDRQTGQAYTFDGERPIVKVGKMNTRETRVDIVYTEETADAYEVARAQFEAAGGGVMYARWSPAGGSVGDFRFTTDAGFVKDFWYPEVDSEATGPMRAFFVIQHATITKSVVASGT
jgi:hypothetical protein